MKFFRNFFISLPNNSLFWFFAKPLAKLGYIWWTTRERTLQIEAYHKYQEEQTIQFGSLFKDLTVMHGPFSGVRYPSMSSFGSSLFAKLIGSYEREIHFDIDAFCHEPYSEVINIGCGEGYYAVGLARRIPSAKVFAYDLDHEARELCKQMALHNGLDVQIEVKAEMTPKDLQTFPFTKKGLIISDCEGYEKTLFNESNVRNLIHCDLIIEIHDFIDIEISYYLQRLFDKTHTIHCIRSTDDIQKVKDYQYTELLPYSLEQRKLILHEGRPSIMEWMICKSKLQRKLKKYT